MSNSWKPSATQELLLRAALWEGDAARDAWTVWIAQHGSLQVDGGSYRLLPLLYLNLLKLEIQHPVLPQLHEIYRVAWYRNQLILRRAAQGLRLLREAEIPTLVLKACALIPLYYRDAGARPMSDADILVPTAQARHALSLLGKAGWTPRERPAEQMNEGYFVRLHAHTLTMADHFDLDLHRHVFHFETSDAGDEPFWDAAIPVELQNEKTRALNPTDQLLHVLTHGADWNPMPPVRWVADACMILRHAEIDWGRFIQFARTIQVVLVVEQALAYLQTAMAQNIPASALDALRQTKITRRERVHYQLMVRPHSEHNTVLKLWYHYGQFQRVMQVYRNEPWLLRFPSFLRDTWDLYETRQVPSYMMRYAANWFSRRWKFPLKILPKDQ